MLVVAEDGDELVAGALNLIGSDTIYGRLWGCDPRVYYPSLHFEACYYQVCTWENLILIIVMIMLCFFSEFFIPKCRLLKQR